MGRESTATAFTSGQPTLATQVHEQSARGRWREIDRSRVLRPEFASTALDPSRCYLACAAIAAITVLVTGVLDSLVNSVDPNGHRPVRCQRSPRLTALWTR